MTAVLAKTVADLVSAVREGRGALLMDLDGVPIEQAALAGGTDLEAIAGEYAGLLHQAQELSTELDCGAPLRFSVRGTSRRIVFAFVPGDLALGVEAGPTALRGQMQQAVAQAAGQLGEL
jgi:predicted regulator of Ras-like GTPase activity (Roadblock/LC7/MglB family)